MKKRKTCLAALLAAALCLQLAACGGSAVSAETSAGEMAAAEDTAQAQTADIAAFTGCWKLDDEPFYFVINDSYEWIAVNLYGEQVGPGYVVAEPECITLCMEDDSELASLWQTGGGKLSDGAGNTLTPTDYIMLLPTAQDALNQTIAFPGNFSNVTVSYPIQLEAYEYPDVSDALGFSAVMGDNTDDYYCNILMAFQPISGYDDALTQGEAAAKPQMVQMMNNFMNSMYGDYLVKSCESDFKNNGSYYSITGYMWLDGSIIGNASAQQICGCMEVRYYGPTGYALVAVTIAPDNRIQNYYSICSAMLQTVTYATDWTTAPKPVPTAQPVQTAQKASDSGDYGTPYYWYDEDGDVWYWNGSSNEFISYGDSGYIDDDSGEYMESNDAGWDEEEYDYYDDYDPWSDPGDSWDDYSDYSYDDEGWGDYFE